jgi:hypothetical protein
MNNLKIEAMLEHLVLQGAIEVCGFDIETGHTIYGITEKLNEVAPEIYRGLNEEFVKSMYEMIYSGPTIMKWKFQ